MSKKMMRRSLVLGALMAFVITGQAWAETLKQSENKFPIVSDTGLSKTGVLTLEGVADDGTKNGGTNAVCADNKDITIDGYTKIEFTGVWENNTINNKVVDRNIFHSQNNRKLIIDVGEVNFKGQYGLDGSGNNCGSIVFHAHGGDIEVTANTINLEEFCNAFISQSNAKLSLDAHEIYLKSNTKSNVITAQAFQEDTNEPVIDITTNNLTIDAPDAKAISSKDGVYNGNPGTRTGGEVKVTATGKIDIKSKIGILAQKGISNENRAVVTIDASELEIKSSEAAIRADDLGIVNVTATTSAKLSTVAETATDLKAVSALNNSDVTLNGASEITATNNGTGRAYGVYGASGAEIDLADTTITASSKEGRAYGVWVDESTIDIADTTITATSENSRAVGIAAANSGNEVYVDGDITINATAGERADGMNLEYSDIDVAGKLTVDATGETDDYQIGAQGVRLAYSTATFTDVDISAKSNTTGKVYGIRMLGDNGATNTQLAISGNADVYAETNGVAYGIVVSTGADLGVEDDLSDTGKNLNVTVIGKEEASAIRAQYGSDINVSANTDVDIVATSESGKAYGVVNSYLTYDSVNYAKAKANISILGNVNIEANGKTGSYAVYNSTDHKKEVVEEVGKTVIGGEGKLVTITGDMYANSGSITTTFGAEGSKFDGKVETVEKGTTTLNFAKGTTWNLKGASTLTNATFGAGSVLKIGKGYEAQFNETTGEALTDGDYAITAIGEKTSLTIANGAKLQIEGIKETTYNIAKGFDNYDVADKLDIADNALLQANEKLNGEFYQVEVKAKEAEQMATEMGVSSSTAQSIANVTTAAQAAEKKGVKADANGTGDAKAVALINAMSGAPSEVVGQVFEAVSKMAEAGGNSATAASIVKNVTGVTNDRLSFNCGHSAPHKGGHGVGLFEEGSGADVWVEYVHGKDKVEDMPSTAGKTSYEGQYNGIVMGVDFKKVNKFQSGIAFNYGEGDTNSVGSAARTHSDYDFWGIGYYGNIHNDDSNVIFDIGYAKTDSDVENTNATGVNFKASPETTTWTAGVKLEKLYQNENVQIVPYTGLRFMSIDPKDYSTECASTKYQMERQNVWLLPLGVSIRQEIANDNGWTVSPRVDLSYIWAFGDTDSEMEFSTLGTKTNIGYEVMDDGSVLGLVGIEAHKGQWGFGVSYSYQKGDHSESKKWFIDANYSF